MKLKSNILFTLLFSVVILSCRKEAEKTPASIPKTKTEMLTSATWKYNEYFIDYNEPNTILAYRSGKTNNLYDLSKSRLNYNSDGSYQETLESGVVVSGTWKFIEGETKIELHVNQQVIIIKVLFINVSNFQWASNTGDVVGRMIAV